MNTRFASVRSVVRAGLLISLAPMMAACMAGPPTRGPHIGSLPYPAPDRPWPTDQGSDFGWPHRAPYAPPDRPAAPLVPDNSAALADLRTRLQQQNEQIQQQRTELARLRSEKSETAPTAAPATPPLQPQPPNPDPPGKMVLDTTGRRCGWWELCNFWQ